LRFAPLTLAAIALVAAVRPIEVVRLLRVLRISPAVVIPLAAVARMIPRTRREMRGTLDALRATGHWTGPLSVLRHPRRFASAMLLPHLRRWTSELCDEPAGPAK
jgi:hypothetical protein